MLVLLIIIIINNKIFNLILYLCFYDDSLMKLHRNVNDSLGRLEKFIFTEWTFGNQKTMALHEWLSPVDQKNYSLDVRNLSWPEYFEDLAKGVRQYLSKESMKNVEAARGKDTL